MAIFLSPNSAFLVGSVILIFSSIIAMIIAKKVDDYSILYQRLSYTGVRSDFEHPRYNKTIPASSYPGILNTGLLISGIFFIIGFNQLNDIVIAILGSMFAIFIIIIGAVDVSRIYKIHLNSVFGSQIAFSFMMLYISIAYSDILTFIVILVVTGLSAFNSYTRRIMGEKAKQNVVAQKLFIYIEAIYLIFLPSILGIK